MSDTEVVFYSEDLPDRIYRYVDSFDEQFIAAFQIPDGWISVRNTWFIVSELRFSAVDMLYPFRLSFEYPLYMITDSYEITDPTDESSDTYMVFEVDGERDILIKNEDSESQEFYSVVCEQIEKVRAAMKSSEEEVKFPF